MPDTTMKCPNCGAEMQGTTFRIVKEIYSASPNDPKGRTILVAHAPTGHFYCEECDSEWIWYLRKRDMRQLDGANPHEKPESEDYSEDSDP